MTISISQTAMRLGLFRFGHRALAAGFLAAFAFASPAWATTYSLADDFSNVNNPNGVWSFSWGTTLLEHFPQPTVPNLLNPASGNGYWGSGPDFNSVGPFLLKTSVNGATTGAYNDNDFLAGDVIIHSPNSEPPIFINWTAPGAGLISYTSDVWYAHSPVVRASAVSALLNGGSLGEITVNNAITRSNPITSLSGANIAVNPGDVLAFSFSRAPGQPVGSLSGLSLIVDFTLTESTVPEPATWAMLLIGFGSIGAALRSRRRSVAAA